MRLAPLVTNRAAQRQAIAPRTVQAIGMIAMDPAEIEAVIAEHVERNPFLSRLPGSGSAGDPHALEARLAEAPTLRDHLARQIGQAFSDPRDRSLALRLADELDDAGYLRTDTATVAASLGAGIGDVERVLERCRGFEPVGLFARDLRDCLALQLRARGEWDEATAAVLERIDVLARRGLDALADDAGLDRAVVSARVGRLRRCDPKPATSWEAGSIPTITPVARVRRDDGGRWRTTLLASAFPRVAVDMDYAAPFLARPDATEFARAALRDARWLETALRRRARTIGAVVGEVVARQTAFLERGDLALRPLTMATVASAVGVHETTVGRAIAGKSIAGPRGTIPLRDLFGPGVVGSAGPVAARAVARRIAQLVEHENGSAPYSDERLAELLRKDGIGIARRTVAKYRQMLAIGSTVERRRAAGQRSGANPRSGAVI